MWDPFVRLFHWSLALAFGLCWWTGEEYYDLHVWAGYAVLGLVCARIAWGFIGSRHARFGDFIHAPPTIIAYIRSLPGGAPIRYVGHNPAGGAMILLMLGGSIVVTVSGIALDGAENWSGPMAELGLFRHAGLIGTIHSVSTDLMLVAIALHLLGVVHASRAHRENLVKAMITGRKRGP